MADTNLPLVYGLNVKPMPDGWTPLEAFVVLKCLDEDGEVALLTRATEGVRAWDSVGMLTAALDTERDNLRAGFIPDDGEDEQSDDE